MKIPKEITGKNKLRNLDICRLYIEGLLPEEIAQERNLSISVRRIQQIISENDHFVSVRIAWKKSKRIHARQRLIQRKLNGIHDESKRDVLDHLDSLREEIEGDKPLIDNSNHKHITIILDGTNASNDISAQQTAERILQK